MSQVLTTVALALSLALTAMPVAHAAKLSSARLEVLKANDYEANNRNQSI
jgi:hypothetical protein